MELGLNLFWLLLALVSVAIFQRRLPRRPRFQRHFTGPRGALLALGCALSVLFPVISVTDDLQAAQAILEDSRPTKQTLKTLDPIKAPSNSGKFSHPSIHFSLFLFCFPHRGAASLVASTGASSPVAASTAPVDGRAPPSLLV